MTRSLAIFRDSVASVLASLILTGCTGSTGGTPTPTPTPTPNGDDDTFRLTIEMRSGNGEARGMNVRVMVDDFAYSRANAPYTNGIVAVGNFTNNEDPDTFELDVAAGKTVTLIATESEGVFSTGTGQSNLDSFVNPFHVEFVTWEGDDETRPEAGVATILMNADKDVAAIYAQMPRIIIRKFDENNPQLNGGCFDVTIDPTPRLSLPGEGDLAGETEGLCCCTADDSNIFFFGQVKTGTVITLNAIDTNICDAVSGTCLENFKEWQGAADLCGASPECMITVGVDHDSSAVWRDNSP